MRLKYQIFALLFCVSSALASDYIDHLPSYLSFEDAKKNYEVNLHAQLMDSLSIINLSNARTHYDNSMSIKLFLNGHFTNAFHFSSRVKINTDYTNRYIPEHSYNPYEGIPYNKQNENKRTWDLFAANASYQLKPIKLMAGFDYLEWGPARKNHVILRGNKNPYRPWFDTTARIFEPAPTPYFGYLFEIGPVVYTQYTAKLFEKKGFNKFIHLHRLDLNISQNISLSVSESALYGSTTEFQNANPNPDADSIDRDLEWAYVIPFIPYVFQEHLQGDRDNISLAFDLSIKTIPHWEFYAELLWDDMKSPTSMFDSDWWGNKWATSIGIARDSLKIKDAFFNWYSEYTRIEPWVYTHHKGGGYTYATYAQNLGSNLGPNSQEFYTELSYQRSFITATLFASAVATDTSFGGNINDIHTPDSRTDKHYLKESSTVNYKEFGLSFELISCPWIRIKSSYSRYFGDYEGFRSTAVGSVQF